MGTTAPWSVASVRTAAGVAKAASRREFSRDEILGHEGVPPLIAGYLTRPITYNASEQKEMYWESTIWNFLTEEIATLESDSDTLYDEGMKALYAKHREGNTMPFIIGAEIYDHLEKVVDRFEDVANRINGVLVEHL